MHLLPGQKTFKDEVPLDDDQEEHSEDEETKEGKRLALLAEE
jgi:hypothetical protein